ncbi:hypothetical protein AgCh_013266 [Apium graveolens]
MVQPSYLGGVEQTIKSPSSSGIPEKFNILALPPTPDWIAYRKFRKGKKFSRKGASSDKKSFRKSEGKEGKSDRGDYTNVKCYNCDEKGHISPDCKKVKSDKGKALVTKKESWTDTSDSESEVNYALMANADSSSDTAGLKKWKEGLGYGDDKNDKGTVETEILKFSRKGASSDKKSFRKSEGKGGKSDRGDYTNVKCYNCDEKGHISPDCKKVKSDKGKALVTKKKNWTDTSDSESEVNYALMANADSSSEAAELKVPQTTYAFHTDDINELRRYLKTMFISYRDQNLTCERLTSENLACKKRNDYLEKELVMFHQTQKDRDDVFYVWDEVLKMYESLKTELEKEREIIRIWTNPGRTTQNLLSSGNWKEGLGYGDDKNDKRTVQIKPIVIKQKPKVKPVKFVAEKSDTEKSEVK